MNADDTGLPRDGIVVRVADGNDLDAVISVGHRTWLATYEPIAGPEYVAMGLAKWWTKDVVTASIRTGRTLVAVDTRSAPGDGEQGQVIGMATFGVQDDTFYAWKLYVLPGHHGRRIGSRLWTPSSTGPASSATTRWCCPTSTATTRRPASTGGTVSPSTRGRTAAPSCPTASG